MIATTDATVIARRSLRDPRGALLVARVERLRLTYLDIPALLDLRDLAHEADKAQRPGAFIEAGCALGGSAIVLAGSKNTGRPLFVYDVFGMIPPPSERDGRDVFERYEEIRTGRAKGIQNDGYYGYEAGLLSTVEENFRVLGLDPDATHVHLVQGLFEDTLHPSGPVALAHIDGDWYDSVAVCLQRIWPRMSPGGVVVIDDYDDWSGCRRAVADFLSVTTDVHTESRQRLHLVKDGPRP